MEKKVILLPPTMPNFVRYEMPIGKKQDGFKTDRGFDIAEFTESEAIEYGELMKKCFIRHWKERKLKYP